MRPGPRNLITDVPGLRVGHATDEAAGTGVTTILTDSAWVGAVDVRGGGPGVRETDTLAPENLVPGVHAVVLSGGSVFGLAAADGVVARLSVRGVGLKLAPEGKALPIVPSAILFDLAGEGDKDWGEMPPYRALGLASVDAAEEDFALGSVGAGRGARAGQVKGGIGSVSLDLGEGLMVGALAAVNPVGSVFMPDGKTFWAWPFEIDGEYGGAAPDGIPLAHDPMPAEGRLTRPRAGTNTTLVVVATNAALDKGEAKRVAMMAQDGIARAVRPAHTPFDGDIVFAIAGDAVALPADAGRQREILRIGSAAADCVARAIARGVFHAR
ncbi:P1 family peptidase [Sphingomonas sp. CGMCC 1.13654]|uniref:P1 family peptidase n=1 Tax=Sphingomonas chungangi TaxID=2683589 RepID=A0A838L7K7_9SPHN|nr:P1 family peptidase [Sphingomonas chungangi]MBA2934900.1 P1 family peptidase [Sphingomonas chungangi]MVW58211.1 peptidase T4 [Sphingomonas chungangi]